MKLNSGEETRKINCFHTATRATAWRETKKRKKS